MEKTLLYLVLVLSVVVVVISDSKVQKSIKELTSLLSQLKEEGSLEDSELSLVSAINQVFDKKKELPKQKFVSDEKEKAPPASLLSDDLHEEALELDVKPAKGAGEPVVKKEADKKEKAPTMAFEESATLAVKGAGEPKVSNAKDNKEQAPPATTESTGTEEAASLLEIEGEILARSSPARGAGEPIIAKKQDKKSKAPSVLNNEATLTLPASAGMHEDVLVHHGEATQSYNEYVLSGGDLPLENAPPGAAFTEFETVEEAPDADTDLATAAQPFQ